MIATAIKNHLNTEIVLGDLVIESVKKVSVLSERNVYPALPLSNDFPKTAYDSNIKHTVVLQGATCAGEDFDVISLSDFTVKIGDITFDDCNWKKINVITQNGENTYNLVIISYSRSESNE